MALSHRQQAFVDAYTGNGTAAARAAGYGGDDATLAVQASRLLKLPKIQQALAARNAKVEAQVLDNIRVGLIAGRHQRQAFWTQVMNDVSAEMADRLRASELLGKSEADFTAKVQHDGAVPVKVIDPYAEGE